MSRQIKPGGFVLVGVLLLSIVLVIITTTLVFWVQQESHISVKHRKSSIAFNLAEAAVDQGRWKLQERSDNWTIVASGVLPGYDFDQTYEGIGGIYAIKISSDPTDSDRRIIEGVGKDSSSDEEVRRVKAIFATNAVDFSIQARLNLVVGGSADIHWGPVMAGASIETDGRDYPRYYSRGHILDRDGGDTYPKTDGVQWWSYFDLPPAPQPDVDMGMEHFYYSSASASGADPCGGNYLTIGDRDFQGCQDCSWKTYYITGAADFDSGGAGNFICGNVIVIGDLEISGGGSANGDYDANVPQEAWKEYGNDWGRYWKNSPQGFEDTLAPASYDLAVAQNYKSAPGLTYNLDKVLVHGFLYTGGSTGLNGGGNSIVHGVMIAGQNTTIATSGFTVYFDDTVAETIAVANIVIRRVAWYEVTHGWPAGL